MILIGIALVLLAILGAPLFAIIAAGALIGFAGADIDLMVVPMEIFRVSDIPVLIAIPLFLTRKEYSRSAGGIWGLGTIIVYFGLVQLGDGLIQDQTLSAAVGVWLPNVIVGAGGVWLFSTIASKGVFGREVDRQRGAQSKRRERNFRGARRWALPRYVAGRFLQYALVAFGVLLILNTSILRIVILAPLF